MIDYIGGITKDVRTIPFSTPCSEVDQLFQANQRGQGLVIVREDNSAALITRTNFYQKMGTQYGYNLYYKKPVELLADPHPLIVDYYTSVIEVSKSAMDRTDAEVYDDIIVKKENQIFGIVSIKNLLLEVSNIQIELASYLNPLTLLPGNKIIDERLENTFNQLQEFTLLYIDLDRFKSYNDSYSFKKGDELLQTTANILKSCLVDTDHFLGHIGGDDFIIMLHHHRFESICEGIIQAFDLEIPSFYSDEHLLRKTVYTENRFGKLEEIPLVTVSIAVVKSSDERFGTIGEVIAEAARIKKICKLRSGSCFYAEPSSELAANTEVL